MHELDDLRARLREFAAARDWQPFHSPKNLAMALAGESGELLDKDSQDKISTAELEAADTILLKLAETIVPGLYRLRIRGGNTDGIVDLAGNALDTNDPKVPHEDYLFDIFKPVAGRKSACGSMVPTPFVGTTSGDTSRACIISTWPTSLSGPLAFPRQPAWPV